MTTSGPDPARGHRLLPHTADVIVEAWGPDDVACAEEAARGLVELCVSGEPDPGAGNWKATIGTPPPDRVRAVLDEVIFALDTSELAPVAVHLEPGRDSGVELRLGLAPRDAVRLTGAAPKAIVMLDPESSAGDRSVRCRFIVDV